MKMVIRDAHRAHAVGRAVWRGRARAGVLRPFCASGVHKSAISTRRESQSPKHPALSVNVQRLEPLLVRHRHALVRLQPVMTEQRKMAEHEEALAAQRSRLDAAQPVRAFEPLQACCSLVDAILPSMIASG